VAAVYGDACEVAAKGGRLDESHWNESSSVSHNPYSYSKTVAEREAWKLVESATHWDLVTINPSFVLGPSLTPRKDSTSIDTILSMMDGRYRSGLPYMGMAVVDVREVARAHLEALIRPEASGRHIVSAHDTDLHQVSQVLGRVTEGRYRRKLPLWRLPKAAIYLIGPLEGFSWSYTSRNIGHPVQIDNRKAREELGINFRPLEESLRDQVAQIESMGLV
jgi:nucleoside-diphosphate-sugar epimerase